MKIELKKITVRELVGCYVDDAESGERGRFVNERDTHGQVVTSEDMGIDIIYDLNGVRQLLTPSRFADVQAFRNGYDVRVYAIQDVPSKDSATGLYAVPSVSPYRVLTVRSDNGGKRAVVTLKTGSAETKTDSHLNWDAGLEVVLSEMFGSKNKNWKQKLGAGIREASDAVKKVADVIGDANEPFKTLEDVRKFWEKAYPDGIPANKNRTLEKLDKLMQGLPDISHIVDELNEWNEKLSKLASIPGVVNGLTPNENVSVADMAEFVESWTTLTGKVLPTIYGFMFGDVMNDLAKGVDKLKEKLDSFDAQYYDEEAPCCFFADPPAHVHEGITRKIFDALNRDDSSSANK